VHGVQAVAQLVIVAGEQVARGKSHDRGKRELRRQPRRPARGPLHREGGIARAMFRVAVSGRREQEPSFFTVVVWRDQAEHAAQSLAKGSRVVVAGRLQQRSWTAEDGSHAQPGALDSWTSDAGGHEGGDGADTC
jgi:hypothetical protein